eukprot:3721333-Rhodomonas_salina.1
MPEGVVEVAVKGIEGAGEKGKHVWRSVRSKGKVLLLCVVLLRVWVCGDEKGWARLKTWWDGTLCRTFAAKFRVGGTLSKKHSCRFA